MEPTRAAAAALDEGPKAFRLTAALPAERIRAPRRVRNTMRAAYAGPLAGVIAQLVLVAVIGGAVALSGVSLNVAGWVVGITCGAITNVALAHGLAHYRVDRMSPADWVTLARATLAVGVAALIAASFGQPVQVAMLVSIAAVALLLDAVDGWVARRTRTGLLGARFDGEVDAFLILVLSVYVARFAGAWVLAIGAARYVFLVAGWPIAWLRAPLPPRFWRKVVAAAQGIVLVVAAAKVLPPGVTQAALGGALALLGESFGRDTWWLWRHRPVALADQPVTRANQPATRASQPASRSRERSRVRTTLTTTITILAALIVWAALVAPDRPQDLTPTAFLRLPLEGVVAVALAAIAPTALRRAGAALLGPVLGLIVILKILDIGFFNAFARPFDPVGDLGNLGTGVETLRSALGRSEANLLIVGGVALAVAVLLLTTLSLFRLAGAAARNRRLSIQAIAVLGAVWGICSLSGAALLPGAPIASTTAFGFAVHEVQTVQADIRDDAFFAKQISNDPFRNTPGNRLLTALRGKDVLLVFVESYGQVSVQGSSFSPAIDDVLRSGTVKLHRAGFAARSAFVNAPGFGGISWLAHSTLQSGVWANSQRRYNELVGTHRFTLTDAFNRAGWRTINFAPADDRDWPEGASYYHYDKLYDRRNIGYHGPGYSYAPMPDQYMFSALQRLELAKTHRRPLFAEVDTVSSHMPWNRIPQQIPWGAVGNGSVFNRTAMFREPDSFWWRPNQVKAAYARSLEYSLNTLISFVQRYGRKNLVMVVVGDEQPLPIVSGQGANHEVPISVIAHDPAVIRRIGGWNWQSGLLPSPDAAVWPMSAFRNRFLTAFGPAR
jgi:hypothetical protein